MSEEILCNRNTIGRYMSKNINRNISNMDSYINRYAKDTEYAENGQHKNIFKKSSHIKSFSIEMQKYA